MNTVFRNNGLSIVMFALFGLCWIGQIGTGYAEYNGERQERHEAPVALGRYLTTGHFVEASAENWESEFLQMAAFAVFTAFLYQRGSAESKPPGGDPELDADPRDAAGDPDAPGPVKRGGVALKLYQNSLGLTLMALFFVSFALHAWGGALDYSEERRAQGEAAVSALGYLGTTRFWFESLQNWQSEFMSVGAMVVLTIFLRQKGSPESKPVGAPNAQTG